MKNYEMAKRLVGREVIHCASNMVSELSQLRFTPNTADIVSAMDPDFSPPNERRNLVFAPMVDGEYGEIYEHWIVSKWLGKKLYERGEVVGELFDFTIWARTTTGQEIALDEVIQSIAEEIKI